MPGSDTRRQGLIRITAWLLVALIAAATLVPLGLRPVVTANPGIERSAAFALAGLLMALSYPRHWRLILVGSILLAGGLEAAQTLTSTRHGRVDDFLMKAGSVLAGVIAGLALAGRTSRCPDARANPGRRPS